MKRLIIPAIFMLGCLMAAQPLFAQPEPGVYLATEKGEQGSRHFLLLLSENYMIQTVYNSGPAHFISTLGGFYQSDGDSLHVALEFDTSQGGKTGNQYAVSYAYVGGKLVLDGQTGRPYTREPALSQPLDGQWLFATRGPDTGQERRGNESPRKTLKFLKDGYFQWIAYNSETMEFSGTGGGRYAADNGTYTEVIQFFSRDDSRVGAELSFLFERQGNDWHHTGNNSRGEPMYEIWAIRN